MMQPYVIVTPNTTIQPSSSLEEIPHHEMNQDTHHHEEILEHKTIPEQPHETAVQGTAMTTMGEYGQLDAESSKPVLQRNPYISLLFHNKRFMMIWMAGVLSGMGNYFSEIGFLLMTFTIHVSMFMIGSFILGSAAGVIWCTACLPLNN
ncbi:hypothetical protein C9374_008276 [Naegleria lovaniensis]|uniref:Uncharacterized protein n=1 Tax=Naegleria lovaniensis TaxID=51637 RepID=A0AA88GFR9_NAELO|nr:uncharacterized protein C9374_008276 [Naegleria lovaniensis]KAG2378637.1 hypothetical protein C9374_008276 [Naegleria lovaniensis]